MRISVSIATDQYPAPAFHLDKAVLDSIIFLVELDLVGAGFFVVLRPSTRLNFPAHQRIVEASCASPRLVGTLSAFGNPYNLSFDR